MRARRRAEKADARRVDAEATGLAAQELHAGEHVLHGFGKGLGLGGEPIGDGEHGDAAGRQIGPPMLEGAARALHPAAAMHGDQSRSGLRIVRQIEVALQLDAVMISIGDAAVQDRAGRLGITHCMAPFFRCDGKMDVTW